MKEVSGYNPSKDPRLIDCKTECGNDKCYARRYGLFADKACPNFVEPKPTTNYDRIRSMTDEELAAAICKIEQMQAKQGHRGFHAWLNWLRQEAKDAL